MATVLSECSKGVLPRKRSAYQYPQRNLPLSQAYQRSVRVPRPQFPHSALSHFVNNRLLRALRREPVDRTPIWLMRQAGRSLPRYRSLREERPFFEVLKDPEASAQITALPLDYYPLDAAVLYNDLATPFLAAGFELELRKGVGPVVDRPIRSAADVNSLPPFEPREALKFNLDAIRILVERLDVPVLGFVGAPFTLCSYLVGGPRSRDLSEIKRFLWEEPKAWERLATYWADHLAEFCIAQHEAGAAAVQVFDSWAGASLSKTTGTASSRGAID